MPTVLAICLPIRRILHNGDRHNQVIPRLFSLRKRIGLPLKFDWNFQLWVAKLLPRNCHAWAPIE